MKKRVVIVGAGFAGLGAACVLGKKSEALGIEVVLLDSREQFIFSPRLIDVLQDEQTPADVSFGLEDMAQRFGFTFRRATLKAIDRNRRELLLTPMESVRGSREMSYDILVLAQGAQTNFYGIEGAQENSFPLKSLDDVMRIKQALAKNLQAAQHETDAQQRRSLLSVTVVGGGASGVEALFALQLYAQKILHELHAQDMAQEVSYSLVQAAPQILTGFIPAVVAFAQRELTRMKAQVFLGVPVSCVTKHELCLTDGRSIPSSLTVWTAGLTPIGIEIEPKVDLAKGNWIQTDQYLRVSHDVFVAGDASSFAYERAVVPKNAQTARMMAQSLADNIERSLMGRELKPFHYTSKGVMLLTGLTGALQVKFLTLSGGWVPKVRKIFYDHMFKGMMS